MSEQKGMVFKKTSVIKNLAQYDPELAEQLAMSDEPLEQVIAQELAMWKIVKDERIKNMDMETLMSAFAFFREMMKLCIGMLASTNQMFFMQFLQQYEYTAGAVAEALRSEKPSPKDIIALKVAEGLDRIFESMENMQKAMIGGGVSGKEEEGGKESGSGNSRTKTRRHKVSKKSN